MGEERIVTTTCAHNCSARCMLKVHVRDGIVTRISSDDNEEKEGYHQLRACLRGRAYRERLYHPDRLKYPLKRVGKRGEGNFSRISWDEATTIIANQLRRITEKYGPASRYINSSSGIGGVLAEREFFRRLLSVYGGGYLNYHNSYSAACAVPATEYTFGTFRTGSSRDNWQHARLIILWGHNPAETTFGTNTTYYLKLAKEKGARIIVIDPRYSDSAVALADEWIPLLPTTDNALMAAMIYVMIIENLYDRQFVEKYCLGFDEAQMPEGISPGNSLSAYIFGHSDGTAKTPAWAEAITGVPAGTICRLAREFATLKPAALIQGLGPQRHAYGEQPVRGAAALAAITGNVGVLGGWASGCGIYAAARLAALPYDNPVKASISCFTWPEAILRGPDMGPADGLKNAKHLPCGIKFMASLAGNCLVNQHADINSTAQLLADEGLCEFILVADEFMTSSAMFADLLLPSTNFMERIDIIAPWSFMEYVVFQDKAVEPRYECRTGYDWMLEVAEKLGVGKEFSQGKTYEDWARYIVDKTREQDPAFPSYAEFTEMGFYEKKIGGPQIAFREQIENFDANPFPTPSGKIEIFSPRLFALGKHDEIPAVPRYIPSWEGPEDPLKSEFPLQLIGWHSKRSTHSTMFNSNWLEETVPHCLWINPKDAKPRKLADGDRARVFNRRGELEIKVKVTARIMPGVVAIPQGAWYKPVYGGTGGGGCINTLTSYRPTPWARGNPQHTNLVQVEIKAGESS